MVEKRIQAIGVIILAIAFSFSMLHDLLHWEFWNLSGRFTNLVAWGSCALGLHLLWTTGSYRVSPVRRYQSIAGALFMVYIILRIMHWSYAAPVMLAAVAGVMVVYAIHFALKPTKDLRDILRLLVVLVCCTMFALIQLHEISGWHGYWVASGIIAIAALEYLLNPQSSLAEENVRNSPEDETPLSKNTEDEHPELFN